jgi:hypothetical protein
MNKHNLIARFVVISAFAFAAFTFQTAAQESASAKAARILNESKVKFTKVADNIWSVPYNGKALKNFDVLISTDPNILIMFVDIAAQKDYKPSAEMFSALLIQNAEMDRVKIGLDKNRAVYVRIDLSIRLLDRKEFVENLDQLAAASDQIYGMLQPHLVKPN